MRAAVDLRIPLTGILAAQDKGNTASVEVGDLLVDALDPDRQVMLVHAVLVEVILPRARFADRLD